MVGAGVVGRSPAFALAATKVFGPGGAAGDAGGATASDAAGVMLCALGEVPEHAARSRGRPTAGRVGGGGGTDVADVAGAGPRPRRSGGSPTGTAAAPVPDGYAPPSDFAPLAYEDSGPALVTLAAAHLARHDRARPW